MPKREKNIEARLLYESPADIFGHIDVQALKHLVRKSMQDCDEVQVSGRRGEHLLLSTPHMQLLVAYSATPFPLSHFRGVTRPAEEDTERREILRRLAGHRASLSVAVLDPSDRPRLPQWVKKRLVWEVADYLLACAPADLVLAPDQARLMTGDEAIEWLSHLSTDLPQFDPNASPERNARKEIFLSEPQLSPEVLRWLDQRDAPQEEEEDLWAALLHAFADEEPKPGDAKLSDTVAGRSALYTMSATIGLFALPLGAAALAFNALTGGSLRATAYAMAAAGIGTALEKLDPDATSALFPLIGGLF